MQLLNSDEYRAGQEEHPSVFPWRMGNASVRYGCTIVDALGQTVCLLSKGTASSSRANAEFIIATANAAYEATGRSNDQ